MSTHTTVKLFKTNTVALVFENNAHKFFEALSSNTLTASHNAFLDRFGKIVATFAQKEIAHDRILIVIEQSVRERLLNHLGKYLKLSKVKVTVLPHHVYYDLVISSPPEKDAYTLPQSVGTLIVTKKRCAANVSEEEFTLFRLTHHIPLQGIDYTTEMILNIFPKEYVSYTKGCYLGQEIVTKVHNLADPPKKLVAKYEDECASEEKKMMTSKVRDPKTKKVKGFILVHTA